MKFYPTAFITRMATIAICASALCACEGKPSRKKLPDFTGIRGWEEMPLKRTGTQPFFTSDTTMIERGKRIHFFSIAMPDPVYDSLAMGIARDYEPLVSLFLEQWSKQGRGGILIDLHSQEDNGMQRVDFMAEKISSKGDASAVPVVLIWDRASAYRAEYLVGALKAVPGIKCTLLSDSRQTEGVRRQDCFSRTAPGFDQE